MPKYLVHCEFRSQHSVVVDADNEDDAKSAAGSWAKQSGKLGSVGTIHKPSVIDWWTKPDMSLRDLDIASRGEKIEAKLVHRSAFEVID